MGNIGSCALVMPGLKPLTIEILGETDGSHAEVLDRVIGGTIFLDEAKRIARHLFEITAAEIPSHGFRILSCEHEVIYEWRAPHATKPLPREGA